MTPGAAGKLIGNHSAHPDQDTVCWSVVVEEDRKMDVSLKSCEGDCHPPHVVQQPQGPNMEEGGGNIQLG